MLHIVGFTSTNHTYTAGVIFITRETIEWYHLAMKTFFEVIGMLPVQTYICDGEKGLWNALSTEMPKANRIRCLWHLEENIKANCATFYKAVYGEKGDGAGEAPYKAELRAFRKAWKTLTVQTRTLEAFEDGKRQFREMFAVEVLQGAVEYAIGLLDDDGEHFVHAHVDDFVHFGQRANSRIEGTHHALKEYLEESRADFYYVIDRLREYFQEQWHTVTKAMEDERSRKAVGGQRIFDVVSFPYLPVQHMWLKQRRLRVAYHSMRSTWLRIS